MKLHRDLVVVQKTAWHRLSRIRKAYEEVNDLFDGEVEVDESYFGGKEGNKHTRGKLNTGRGTTGKTAAVGMKDRETNYQVGRNSWRGRTFCVLSSPIKGPLMLFFKNTARYLVVVCALIVVAWTVTSCDGPDSEPTSVSSDRASQTQPTFTVTPKNVATPTAPATPTAEKQSVFTVNSAVVNVRQGPGTNFGVIDQVTEGQKFEANGTNQFGDWLRFCCVDGGDGWIYKPLVIIENAELPVVVVVIPTPLPSPTTVPPPTPKPAQPTQAAPDLLAGIMITPENRCSPYDSDEYSYPQSVEPQIIAQMGGIVYSPYTGQYFRDRGETDIEHIVARSEAHDSGLCGRDTQSRRNFARDLLNLTLADPSLNRHQKSAKDLAEWLPHLNQCWFVKRVIDVKKKYNLSMDTREAEAARRVLANCPSFEMVVSARTESVSPPTATSVPVVAPVQTNWLAKCDSNNNRRITCAEAAACGISHPVPSSHPAYQHMRDGDGDGQVCE